MSLAAQLKGDALSWLLEAESPSVRYLALRDLCDLPDNDPELLATRKRAHNQGPIATILSKMDTAGFWSKPGPGYNPKYFSTVWSLITLAQLGACASEDERVRQACAYLTDQALTTGGQFSISGSPSGTIDCLQGNLCWALLELGCNNPCLDLAFEWMARTVTGEGIAPVGEKKAATRYYSYKCGPRFACGANAQLPCAWGGTKVMLALGKLPVNQRTPIIQKAIQVGIDFLFSVDPATAEYPSATTGRPSQNWWKFSFPVFYVTDLLQVVEALANLGYAQDLRLASALELIRNKQDDQGRWPLEYNYKGKTWVDYGSGKQPNKWVTLRALRVLKAAS